MEKTVVTFYGLLVTLNTFAYHRDTVFGDSLLELSLKDALVVRLFKAH